jgi:hypothetical protein
MDRLPQEALEQLTALGARLDQITDRLADQAAGAKVPPTLFHYTNSEGFKGITETGRLRLSDVFTLNDPSEMRHEVKYALGVLQRSAAKGHRAAQLFAWRFSEHLGDNLERISRQFVACFSPSGDDLGQWRAYANNGHGFALGFDGPKLEAAFLLLPHLTATFAVNYEEQQLQKAAEAIATEALHVAEFPVGRGYDGPTLSAFLSAILHAAMLFKHPAYIVEREYRFQHVRSVDNTEGIVTVGNRCYIEFDWKSHGPNLLTHVIVGPAAEQQQARQFAEECLRLAGIDVDSVRIEASTILTEVKSGASRSSVHRGPAQHRVASLDAALTQMTH